MMPLDLRVNDQLTFKKKHACGSPQWTVLRTGMDFMLECQGCGHRIWMNRTKVEKALREVKRDALTYSPKDLQATLPTDK